MTEPMQRPDHEASRWPRDFDIRQRYAEQQELLSHPRRGPAKSLPPTPEASRRHAFAPAPTKREQRLISGKGATVFLLKRFTFDPDRATTVPRLSSTSFEDPP